MQPHKFHLGIYAIIEKEQSLLLVKKTRGPYKNMWDLPGGRPHLNETIFETLQREVLEETGIQLIRAIPYLSSSFTVEYLDGKTNISLHHMCIIYKAIQYDASQFNPNIDFEDVSHPAWIKKSQLANLPVSKLVAIST